MKEITNLIPIYIAPTSTKKLDNLYSQKRETVSKVNVEEIKKQIDEYLTNDKISKKEKPEIAFYGSNFFELSDKVQETLLKIVDEYVVSKKVRGAQIRINPINITVEKIRLMKKHHIKTVEIILGSSSNYILKKSKRKYTIEDIRKIKKMFRFSFIKTGYVMNIGMIDSKENDEFNTAKEILKLKPKFVVISPMLVYKGTELAKKYATEDYEALSVDAAAQRCKEITYMFKKNGLDDVRIELYDTNQKYDDVATAENVVAGPFHPAFNKYVEGMMWYDSIAEKIKNTNSKVKRLEVEINPEDLDRAVGYNKANIEKLKDMYDIKVDIKSNPEMQIGKFEIKVIENYQ